MGTFGAVLGEGVNILGNVFLGLWTMKRPTLRRPFSFCVALGLSLYLQQLCGTSFPVSLALSVISQYFGSKLSVVGLTGGIAAGKSTVSSIFKSEGVPIIDADLVAREIVLPGQPAHKAIVSHFGKDILLSDGMLDRAKLGGIVFNDPKERKALNGITHPWIMYTMFMRLLKLKFLQGENIVLLDAALLFEMKVLVPFCSTVVVVSCPSAVQLKRLMARNNLSEKDALARMNSQMPIEEKMRLADIVLDNGGTLEQLQNSTTTLVRRLKSSGGSL